MGRSDVNKTVSIAVMLTYNLLVTAYLLYLGLAGQLVGILLWPVIALHALFTLLFAYAWSNDREPKQRRLR